MITKLAPQRNLFGDKEWAKYKMNFITGCANQCKYCFSCAFSYRVVRVSPGNWKLEIIRKHDLNCKMKKYDGTIMIPASHDISVESLEVFVNELRRVLEVGTVVSFIPKPNLKVLKGFFREFVVTKIKRMEGGW